MRGCPKKESAPLKVTEKNLCYLKGNFSMEKEYYSVYSLLGVGKSSHFLNSMEVFLVLNNQIKIWKLL